MNINERPAVMKQSLPPGHKNLQSMSAECDEFINSRMNKSLHNAVMDLRKRLNNFLKQNTDWFYGTYPPGWGSSIDVWCINYSESYHNEESEWIPPNIEISFWKKGPTYLFKGKKLGRDELTVPALFIEQFLDEHPELGCKTEIAEPWAVTYRIFSKNSKPRKR